MEINKIKIPALLILFCLKVLESGVALGAEEKAIADTSAFLREATAIIAEGDKKFISKQGTDALIAKLSILESQSDLEAALKRARAIKNPFYRSLALGGIASGEIPVDPQTSAKHFREALAQAKEIKEYTGTHATSLRYLFELPPFYPQKEAHALLNDAMNAFATWDGSDVQKNKSLLSLAQATTAISPKDAKALLYDVALKSNHYWASNEYLATYMAQQDMEKALKLSNTHYTEHKDWPNDGYFRRAVLIELSKTDFPRAFEGIKKMQNLDQEIAAIKLAEFLLGESRKKEAEQVIHHIDSLKSDFNFTQSSLKKLYQSLEQGGLDTPDSNEFKPKDIDVFLKNPSAQNLQFFSLAEKIQFRDEVQIRAFISSSLPHLDELHDQGYPHHGSPSSMALGLLVVSSALIQDIPGAIELSKRIKIPELRAKFLLDAYEVANPMTEVVSNWPIHFWLHTHVQIR